MDNNTQPDSSNTFPTPSPVVSTQKIWLGAFGIYSISRKAVMLNIVPIVELWLINIIISILFFFFFLKKKKITKCYLLFYFHQCL